MLTKFVFDDGWRGFDVSMQMERHINFNARGEDVKWDIKHTMNDVIHELLPDIIPMVLAQFTDEVDQAQLEFFRQWSRSSN